MLTGDLGYLKLGLSPVDMDVLEALPHDKDLICDLLRFPGQLLNGSKGTTFSNMGEAGAALYSRCVIPPEAVMRDGLNRWLGRSTPTRCTWTTIPRTCRSCSPTRKSWRPG